MKLDNYFSWEFRKNKIFGVLLVFIVFSCLTANAWFFGSSEKKKDAENTRKNERVFRTLNERQVKVFRQLVDSRQKRQEEIKLIERLGQEKRGEMEMYSDKLADEFEIDPTLSYSYDSTNRTVYLLQTPSDKAPPDAATTENRLHASNVVPHKVLAAGQENQLFIRLLAAKRLTRQQVNLLNMLIREKQLEMKKVQHALSERFGIDPERNYRFEADTQTLYIVEPPMGE